MTHHVYKIVVTVNDDDYSPELGFEQAVNLIKDGFCSGLDSNEDEAYEFYSYRKIIKKLVLL